jgi:hypothetical protein
MNLTPELEEAGHTTTDGEGNRRNRPLARARTNGRRPPTSQPWGQGVPDEAKSEEARLEPRVPEQDEEELETGSYSSQLKSNEQNTTEISDTLSWSSSSDTTKQFSQ